MKRRRVKAATKVVGRAKPRRRLKDTIPVETGGNSSDSDVNSDDFYHDEIDDYHAGKEKILLGDRKSFLPDVSSGEEEVLPITDDEDAEEEEEEQGDDDLEEEEDQQSLHESDEESDVEGKSDDDLPNLDAWGKRKSTYYSTDFVDKDWGKSYREEDEEKAKAEETGAMEMQVNFDASDIIGDIFDVGMYKIEKELSDEEEAPAAVIDRSSILKDAQLKFLKKDFPELFLLAEDFKELMKELIERISPLVQLVKDGRIQGSGAQYIMLKYNLILHYCMNISFYMMLKSRQEVPAKYHPVMKRASSYKKLLNELEPLDEKLKGEIDIMLEKLKNKEDIEFAIDLPEEPKADETTPVDRYASLTLPTLKRLIAEQTADIRSKTKKQKIGDLLETDTEKEVTSLYMDMKKQQRDSRHLTNVDDESDQLTEEEEDYDERHKELEIFENDDETADEKRIITYEIAKNKGLVPYRKKEYRNPRVRNRMKYRRAKIRRKGQVKEPRRELTRYGGEPTGIRDDISRSIKIK